MILYTGKIIGGCDADLSHSDDRSYATLGWIINKQYRNMGFGKYLLKHLLDDILNSAISEGWALKELNASCDADNIAAVSMYKAIGFTEEYTYPQAYHPKTSH